MGKREDNVEKIVIDVCTNYFCKGLFDKGRDILYKLYLSDYPYLDNMHTRRNLLYRLIVAERRSKKGTERGVEMYTRQLKNDMDNTPNYKEDYMGEYLDMMSYYAGCEYINLSDEEKFNHYKLSYNYYKRLYETNKSLDCYICMLVDQFNMDKIERNFQGILNIIKDLHNIKSSKADSTMEQMLCDVSNMDESLYEQVILMINENSQITI